MGRGSSIGTRIIRVADGRWKRWMFFGLSVGWCNTYCPKGCSGFANAVKTEADPRWQEFNSMWSQGIKLFLVREGPFILGQIFDILAKKDYGRLHTSWARVTQTLPISVATSVCPWLNDYYDKWSPTKPQAMVAFSVIPGPSYTDVVCSWLDYCHVDCIWIQKQMGTLEGVERLVNLLGIAESEDLCMNVDFWESIPDEMKELILSNMLHDAFRGQLTDLPSVVRLKREPEQVGAPDRR